MKLMLLLLALGLTFTAPAARALEADKDYAVLSPAQPVSVKRARSKSWNSSGIAARIASTSNPTSTPGPKNNPGTSY